jgi:hypothetical protein
VPEPDSGPAATLRDELDAGGFQAVPMLLAKASPVNLPRLTQKLNGRLAQVVLGGE